MMRTLTSRLLTACAPLSLAFLAGCDIEFPEQEVRLKHDAEADTLDVLFIYQGVTTPRDDADALAAGTAVADRILAGRREFMLLDWPLLWDLDEMAAQDGQVLAITRIIERVSLVEVGAFTDADDRLSAFQHFRMTEVSDTLAQANQLITGMVQLGLLTGELSSEVSWMDDEELDAWAEFCTSGTPWIAIEDSQLIARIPATEAGAAAMLRELLLAAADANSADMGMSELSILLDNLAGLRIGDGMLELRVGTLDEDEAVLRLRRNDVEYQPSLLKHLRNRGLDLSGAPSIEEVRQTLRG